MHTSPPPLVKMAGLRFLDRVWRWFKFELRIYVPHKLPWSSVLFNVQQPVPSLGRRCTGFGEVEQSFRVESFEDSGA